MDAQPPFCPARSPTQRHPAPQPLLPRLPRPALYLPFPRPLAPGAHLPLVNPNPSPNPNPNPNPNQAPTFHSFSFTEGSGERRFASSLVAVLPRENACSSP
eukprot:scaffold60676_cov36-Phaeocystis_antarctica.AAC.1